MANKKRLRQRPTHAVIVVITRANTHTHTHKCTYRTDLISRTRAPTVALSLSFFHCFSHYSPPPLFCVAHLALSFAPH